MTRKIQFSNNATSKLAGSISAAALSCSVLPGEGAKFPALTAGQYFMATLIKADGTKEIVKVTARATDTFTIQRAAEAVGGVATAYAFTAGDKIELRMTAGALAAEMDRLDAIALMGASTKTASYTIVESDVSTLLRIDSSGGARTITLPQISTLTDSFEVVIAKISNDTNVVSVARSGTDTINGLSSYTLAAQWSCVWLIADLATNTWTAINSGSGTGVNCVIDVFTGSGTAGPFNLSGDPGAKSNTAVYVGGVYQNKSTYTLSGTSVTLGGNVSAGVPVEIVWVTPQAFGVPNDGSVSVAKLAADALNLIDGLKDVPANPQSASYTLALTDRGKSIDYSGAGGHTITIPSNSSVAFPVGSVLAITNLSANNLNIAITSDLLLLLDTGSTGARVLAGYGQATLRKVTSTQWVISGSGLT